MYEMAEKWSLSHEEAPPRSGEEGSFCGEGGGWEKKKKKNARGEDSDCALLAYLTIGGK